MGSKGTILVSTRCDARTSGHNLCRRLAGFHRRLPGYAVTPLRELPDIATSLGIERVYVKDEATRLGLPAFKMLGASWAVYRVLSERLGLEPDNWATIDDLNSLVAPLRPLTLAAATDGNHGRAVARMACLLGFSSRIWVPSNTARARIAAIEEEGATVHVSSGGYDDAVATAAAAADDQTIVISDTSWPGYQTVPAWVIEGGMKPFWKRSTIRSLNLQILWSYPLGSEHFYGGRCPSLSPIGAPCTMLIGVEPIDAACVTESIRAGRPIPLPGEQRSIMAGLNCGTPSPIAWPMIAGSFGPFHYCIG